MIMLDEVYGCAVEVGWMKAVDEVLEASGDYRVQGHAHR